MLNKLVVNRLLFRFSSALLFGAVIVFAQPTPPPIAFEVATVKPSAPLDQAAMRNGTAHIGTRIDSSRVDIGTATLFRLICNAYRLRPYQLTGPDWLKTTVFDIQAKIPDGVSPDKVPEMLQTLLAERFGIKLHHESKEQPVYALVVGPGGPSGIKMKESAPEPPPPPGAPKPMEIAAPTLQGDVKMTRSAAGISIEMPGGEIPGKIRVTPNQGTPGQPMRIHLESSGTTMKAFAEMLSVGVVDRPVVDKTELTGAYEVSVDLSEDDAMNVARAAVMNGPMGAVMGGPGGGDGAGRGDNPGIRLADPSGSAIMKSIQSLGLKLDARKLPLDLVVIDHIEKAPSEN